MYSDQVSVDNSEITANAPLKKKQTKKREDLTSELPSISF